MAADQTVPLLKKKTKVYVHGCPGCEQDRMKRDYKGLPYKAFFFVFVATLCSSLPVQSLFPFLYFMIRDLNVAKRVEDIGFYAGFVGSAFMVGRMLTAVFWGVVADRYGRKLVIMFSIVSVIVFNTLFGLSSTYWMAFVTRFLLGATNGLLAPLKAFATEVCREEHQTLALSLFTTTRGIALVIGPAIGGFLAQPADKFPTIFSKDSIWGRFPYFLPCLCISLISLVSFIICLWLPETLHKHGNNDEEDRTTETQCISQIDPEVKENGDNPEKTHLPESENLFKNWPLMSSIMAFCVFSLVEMAFAEIFSLFAVSDKKFGGLSMSSQDVGEVLSITGFSLMVYQLFVYPFITRFSTPLVSARVAAILTIPLVTSFPFMTYLSGFVLSFVVTCASVLRNVFSVTFITCLNILQNNAVPQHQRGTANGISVTAMSFFKAIAPAAGGIVFSWAQKRQHAAFLPGDHMVFFAINVVNLIGIFMIFKPFLALPTVKYDA
ncbi:Major facilitator sugar transporter-like protein [Dioscorea alata]|uniref:Major facilitator sugar transporter-like protein n=1 Tax=Dioscorea alata TaxID=55571 RepID=A0ACB7VS33_DIOAL|nr:Major facilitator sugar transporter-like protein [Dioscorea alata]